VLAYDLKGDGPAIVFIHAGIADRRMWDPQWTPFAPGRRLVRCDLAGFGDSPIDRLPITNARDVIGLLEALGVESAVLVGASIGGRVALEIAVARPGLVSALVLVGPGLPGGALSDDLAAYVAAEDEAVARGDLDAATEINLRFWIDGPRRAAAAVDPAFRSRAAAMLQRLLDLQAPHWDRLDEELLVPDVADRLGEVRAPALVLVGDEDVDAMQQNGERIAAAVPRAHLEPIAGTAHLPSMERPGAFNARVLTFLAGLR
jgi:pimeloyl-ACP methyl ester carboxylesterase